MDLTLAWALPYGKTAPFPCIASYVFYPSKEIKLLLSPSVWRFALNDLFTCQLSSWHSWWTVQGVSDFLLSQTRGNICVHVLLSKSEDHGRKIPWWDCWHRTWWCSGAWFVSVKDLTVLSDFALAGWRGEQWYLIILISLILSEVEYHFIFIRAVAFPFLQIVFSFLFCGAYVLFLIDF